MKKIFIVLLFVFGCIVGSARNKIQKDSNDTLSSSLIIIVKHLELNWAVKRS